MPEFDDRERPTGTLCAACSGEGKRLVETGTQYKAVPCPWCTGGVQTPEQLASWKNRER